MNAKNRIPSRPGPLRCFVEGEPDWEFFLPDDEEAFPEPGDFWIEDDYDEAA